MWHKELFKKVRHIDIRLRRKTHSLFSGSYRSALKGQGLVFSDFREYVPGDDIKAISWSLTAKMSKPYIKTFEEEKTASILLALDISSSMGFASSAETASSNTNVKTNSSMGFASNANSNGNIRRDETSSSIDFSSNADPKREAVESVSSNDKTSHKKSSGAGGPTKREAVESVSSNDKTSHRKSSGAGGPTKREAVELLSGLLAFCAQKNGDFIGLLLFSDKKELYIPPAKGNRQAFRLLKEICAFQGESTQTDIGAGMDFLSQTLKKKSSVFVFSDFLTEKSFENSLKKLIRRHDVNCLIFSDPVERKAPPLGLLQLEDVETGRQSLVDFSSPAFQKKFAELNHKRASKRDKQILRAGCGRIFIDLAKDIYQPLEIFFNKKA